MSLFHTLESGYNYRMTLKKAREFNHSKISGILVMKNIVCVR